jgi:hypothetical protein
MDLDATLNAKSNQTFRSIVLVCCRELYEGHFCKDLTTCRGSQDVYKSNVEYRISRRRNPAFHNQVQTRLQIEVD